MAGVTVPAATYHVCDLLSNTCDTPFKQYLTYLCGEGGGVPVEFRGKLDCSVGYSFLRIVKFENLLRVGNLAKEEETPGAIRKIPGGGGRP